MGSSREEKLAFTNDTRMKKSHKRILLAALFLFGVTLLFFPVRLDHVTGIISGNGPAERQITPANIDYYSSVLLDFNGHPVGIAGIIFFALMPFLVVWQSFSIQRPFGLAATAFLKLQARLMFIGAPYVWYMITYQHGYFGNTTHETSPAFAGWILIVYELVCGVLLFAILADPKGKLARLFD
jgi:hypothetical protein